MRRLLFNAIVTKCFVASAYRRYPVPYRSASVSLFFLLSFSLTLTLSFSLSSCDKLDENGAFDGNWQMTEWRDNATNHVLADRYTKRIYYAVKLNIIQMRDYSKPYDTWHLSYFHRSNDSLYINKVYHRPFDREEPVDSLALYGCAPEGRYAFIKLTHDDMILRNSLYTLTFRKY